MSVKATFFMRVYNVDASLLRRAVESVLNQTEPEFRFIIQDNGTTDGSAEILKEYAQKDKRIGLCRNEVNSIVTQEELQRRDDVFYHNLEECQSQYFAIIDSDDCYEANFLEVAYEAAQRTGADILFSGYQQVGMDGELLTRKVPSNEFCSTNEMTCDTFQEGYSLFRTLWGNLYSANLWKRYWELVSSRAKYMQNGHDTYINLQLLREINCFTLLDKCLYSQTVRNDSFYKSDVRVERVLEGDDLFLQGLQTVGYYNMLNEQMLTFLASVYYYHIQDIVLNVLKRENKELVMALLDMLQRSDVYSMLAEKGEDFQQMLKILQVKGTQLC